KMSSVNGLSSAATVELFSEKMHDFCFTIPYGLLLIGGGLFGYFRKGSTASLAGGVGIGLLLTLAGYFSLKPLRGRRTLCAAILTWVMDSGTCKLLSSCQLVLLLASGYVPKDIIEGVLWSLKEEGRQFTYCPHDWILSLQNCNWREPYSSQDQVMMNTASPLSWLGGINRDADGSLAVSVILNCVPVTVFQFRRS
ncbi:Transmembrane proteins 14C, partial [Prunus dulcis]